jgi:hypothetical protein
VFTVPLWMCSWSLFPSCLYRLSAFVFIHPFTLVVCFGEDWSLTFNLIETRRGSLFIVILTLRNVGKAIRPVCRYRYKHIRQTIECVLHGRVNCLRFDKCVFFSLDVFSWEWH